MSLCYYPTSIALIDDNDSFLRALKLHIGNKFNCNLFCNPKEALEFANTHYNKVKLIEEQERNQRHSDSDNFVSLTLSRTQKKQDDYSRYDELSVIVVDYDMPGINGIELCEQINNPNIKKILLTGRASSADAIKAFNNNIIHYFINKNDENMLELLLEAIYRMQNEYFLDVSRHIKSSAIDGPSSFFSDSALTDYFNQLKNNLSVEEFYYVTGPSRYLLRLKNGCDATLLVYSHQELLQQVEELQADEAPEWIIRQIVNGKYIPYFKTEDGFYEKNKFDEKADLIVADRIEGEKCAYFCALIENNTKKVDYSKIQIGHDNSTLH